MCHHSQVTELVTGVVRILTRAGRLLGLTAYLWQDLGTTWSVFSGLVIYAWKCSVLFPWWVRGSICMEQIKHINSTLKAGWAQMAIYLPAKETQTSSNEQILKTCDREPSWFQDIKLPIGWCWCEWRNTERRSNRHSKEHEDWAGSCSGCPGI